MHFEHTKIDIPFFLISKKNFSFEKTKRISYYAIYDKRHIYGQGYVFFPIHKVEIYVDLICVHIYTRVGLLLGKI